ncbi:hypothetical protein GI364_07865 [Alicyclobacillus sp. SO9]|nr:hypothetical protein GI364_07865 [Alicyclobacillus sp. SO9]
MLGRDLVFNPPQLIDTHMGMSKYSCSNHHLAGYPAAGFHTYEIDIAVADSDLAAYSTLTLAVNAIEFV